MPLIEDSHMTYGEAVEKVREYKNDILAEETKTRDAIRELATRVETERKEREDLEKRINRQGLGGTVSGAGEADEIKRFITADEPAYKAAFLRWAAKGEGDGAPLRALEAKAFSAGSDPDGGYMVPGFMLTGIGAYLKDMGAMRSVANVVPTNTSEYKTLNSIGTAESGWTGETGARSETNAPTLEVITIPVEEVYANPKATQKLLDDSAFDVGGYLEREIGEAFAIKENTAFISGDGIQKPKGILSYETDSAADSSRAVTKVQYVASGHASAFPSSNPGDVLISLVHSLRAGYRANAVWLMNNNTIETIRKFKDGQGNYIWREGDLSLGRPDSLLGYRVVEDEFMPDIGAGAYPIAFGDFRRAYTIVDRFGIRTLRDPYTAKPFVHFYATKRVGGGVTNSQAYKLLKIATS